MDLGDIESPELPVPPAWGDQYFVFVALSDHSYRSVVSKCPDS
jgi:hypothetical protein